MYEKERTIISGVFGKTALAIEHIGSTAVPGIWAKPQIDILVMVENLNQVDKFIDRMIAKGYNYHNDSVVPGEKYFTRDIPGGERLVSVHVCDKNNQRSTASVYFRDYLRSHPEDRDLYSEAKLRAYNNGKTNRIDYPAGKKDVLISLIEKAKKWHEAKNL